MPTVSIRDAVGTRGFELPAASCTTSTSRPASRTNRCRFSIDLEHLSFSGTAPEFALGQANAKIAVRDDNIYLEGLAINTAQTARPRFRRSHRTIPSRTPVMKITTTGKFSLPEIDRVVPALAGYPLHPDFECQGERAARAGGARIRSPLGSRQREGKYYRRLRGSGVRRRRRGRSQPAESRVRSCRILRSEATSPGMRESMSVPGHSRRDAAERTLREARLRFQARASWWPATT